MSIEAAVHYVSQAATIDGLTGTIDTLPDVAFDSQYWLAGGKALSVFGDDHQLKSLNGVPGTSMMVLGHVGADEQISQLSEVRPRFLRAPSSASCVTFYALNSGEVFSEGITSSLSGGKFDARQSGRWHKTYVTCEGAMGITHMGFKLSAGGSR